MDEGQLRKACLEEETPRERRAHSHVERWSRIRTGGERTTDQEWGGGRGERRKRYTGIGGRAVPRNGARFQRRGIWRVSVNHPESVGIQRAVEGLREGNGVKAAEKDVLAGQGERREDTCLKERGHRKVTDGLASS